MEIMYCMSICHDDGDIPLYIAGTELHAQTSTFYVTLPWLSMKCWKTQGDIYAALLNTPRTPSIVLQVPCLLPLRPVFTCLRVILSYLSFSFKCSCHCLYLLPLNVWALASSATFLQQVSLVVVEFLLVCWFHFQHVPLFGVEFMCCSPFCSCGCRPSWRWPWVRCQVSGLHGPAWQQSQLPTPSPQWQSAIPPPSPPHWCRLGRWTTQVGAGHLPQHWAGSRV